MVRQVECPCHVVAFIEAQAAGLAGISRAACRSWKLRAQDASDLHQEVSLRLLVLATTGRAPDEASGTRALFAWARAVARRVARDYARLERRDARAIVVLRSDAPALQVWTPAPSAARERGLVDVQRLVDRGRRSLSHAQLAAIRSLLDGPPSFWSGVGRPASMRNRSRLLATAARRLRSRWSDRSQPATTQRRPQRSAWSWQGDSGHMSASRARAPTANVSETPHPAASEADRLLSRRVSLWHVAWLAVDICAFA